jgi:hypothetical protein
MYCAFAELALVVSQKKSFSKILKVDSRPEFSQHHESSLRSDRVPVVLCDFLKLRFGKSAYDFLNLYGRFCPYNPPYKPRKKSAPPLSPEDENICQKSAPLVPWGIHFSMELTELISEKCSHLREKGRMLMLLKTTLHLLAKAQYLEDRQ